MIIAVLIRKDADSVHIYRAYPRTIDDASQFQLLAAIKIDIISYACRVVFYDEFPFDAGLTGILSYEDAAAFAFGIVSCVFVFRISCSYGRVFDRQLFIGINAAAVIAGGVAINICL